MTSETTQTTTLEARELEVSLKEISLAEREQKLADREETCTKHEHGLNKLGAEYRMKEAMIRAIVEQPPMGKYFAEVGEALIDVRAKQLADDDQRGRSKP